MTDQNTTHTVTYQFIVKAEDAITKAKEFRTQVDQIKEQLKQMAAQTGQPIKDLAEGLRRAGEIKLTGTIDEIQKLGLKNNETKDQIAVAVDAEKQKFAEFTQALSTAKTETTASTSGMSGSFLSLAAGIGVALGLTAFSVVKQFFTTFINYCKEAIEAGYDFTKSLFQMEVGINAMRRNGMDITLGKWDEVLSKIQQKFGVFSQTDLVKGSAQLLLYARQTNLTTDELANLANAAASFAVTTGRSFEDVGKAIGLAVTTGNIRGLYTLGITMSKAQEQAETLAGAYGTTFQKLSDADKATVMYKLLIAETADVSNDATQMQYNLAGAIDAVNAKTTDATRQTGENLLSLKYLWAQTKLGVVEYLNQLLDTDAKVKNLNVTDIFSYLTNTPTTKDPFPWLTVVLGGFKGISMEMRHWDEFSTVVKNFVSDAGTSVLGLLNDLENRGGLFGVLLNPKGAIEDFKTHLDELKNAWSDYVAGTQKIINEEAPTLTQAPLGQQSDALSSDQIDAISAAKDQIANLEKDSAQQREDLAIDLQRDLAKIEADGETKLEDLAAAHAQKMLDISNKAKDDLDNLDAKYALDVQQAQEAYANQLADLAEKHADRQIKIEEDYQEKLRQLREAFIMNLEDALEKRDARQVLRLIRAYNVDKAQADRNHQQQQADEDRNYRNELAAQQRQEALRLAKLKEDLELRRAEIIKARDRELALETEANTKHRIEQQNQIDKEIADRKLKNQQDLDDLDRHLKEREQLILKALADQGISTQLGLDAVLSMVNSAVGPGGQAEALWDYYYGYVQTLLAGIAAQQASMNVLSGVIGGEQRFFTPTTPTIPTTGPHAKGGLEYADKPTSAIFGEAGAELALFMPLSGMNNQSVSSTINGITSDKNNKGKTQIEILLQPGLEGKIINKTLDNVANVVIRSVRQ